jgi:hypothetical protein
MAIQTIAGTARTPSATADASSPPATARSSGGAAARQGAGAGETGQNPPTPPRFPWLSRLALQLESAARQKAPFAPAPVLGDHVDKSA